MPRFDASAIACRVRTYKEGVLSAIAHDLLLDASRIDVVIEAGAIDVSVAAGGLVVLGAIVNGQLVSGELSPSQKAEVQQNMRKKVLATASHPVVRFRARGVARGDLVAGELELHGRTRPLRLQRVADTADGAILLRTSIDQRDFGIKPFRAAFGALKVKPRVDIEVEIAAASASEVLAALGLE